MNSGEYTVAAIDVVPDAGVDCRQRQLFVDKFASTLSARTIPTTRLARLFLVPGAQLDPTAKSLEKSQIPIARELDRNLRTSQPSQSRDDQLRYLKAARQSDFPRLRKDSIQIARKVARNS